MSLSLFLSLSVSIFVSVFVSVFFSVSEICFVFVPVSMLWILCQCLRVLCSCLYLCLCVSVMLLHVTFANSQAAMLCLVCCVVR